MFPYKEVICLQTQFVDIILVNRYYAWYSDVSHTELIQQQLLYDLRGFHDVHNKPVIMSEYGADTIPGFHQVTMEVVHSKNRLLLSILKYWGNTLSWLMFH